MKMRRKLSQKIALVLWAYIKTQFLVVAIVTFVSWGMLTLLGVEYPLLLGVVTGSVSIVPILGLVVTALIVACIAIFDSTRFLPGPAILEGLVVLMLYGALNIGVDYFLSPFLIGKTAKIHPVLLLGALLAGTLVFGFFGAFFSIPALLVIKTIIEHPEK